MRRYRARYGPFVEAYHFEHDEIDSMCVDTLKAAGFLPQIPEPIRIESFIEHHFECVIDYRQLDPGIMGFTSFTRDGRVREVVISASLAEGGHVDQRRVNSTFAHEAGHCLLHAGLFIDAGQSSLLKDDVDTADCRIMCRDNEVGYDRKAGSRWWEYQANRAIGGFLLPRALVFQALDDLLARGAVTGLPSLPNESRETAARRTADVFNVNPIVARIRLSEILPESHGQQEF